MEGETEVNGEHKTPSAHGTEEDVVKQLCGHSNCDSKGTYTVKALCTNCDWSGTIELTRGREFSNSRSCPGCGCSFTLARRRS